MKTKTILQKNGQEVVVSECYKVIDGKVKNFCIEETNQFFVRDKTAIRAASDLLLKKTLPKFRYQEKLQEKRNKVGANRITRTYKCLVETKTYINRWDGELYLETKRSLVKELENKLKLLCEDYGFSNPHEAIGYLSRINAKK